MINDEDPPNPIQVFFPNRCSCFRDMKGKFEDANLISTFKITKLSQVMPLPDKKTSPVGCIPRQPVTVKCAKLSNVPHCQISHSVKQPKTVRYDNVILLL